MAKLHKIKLFLRRIIKSRDFPVFLVFLFLSVCFWFLNALRNEYVSAVDIPVVYSHFPSDMMAANELPVRISVDLKAEGFQLLKYRQKDFFDPIEINVDQLMPYKKGADFGVFFIPKQYARQLSAKISGSAELIDVIADTVHISLRPRRTRKLPVKPLLRLSFEKQYIRSSNHSVIPDSVIVMGAASLIDTMRWISTVAIEEKGVKDSLVRIVNIDTSSGVIATPGVVEVRVPVESFTEKSVMVPVFAINMPENSEFKSFPSTIKVNFLVGLSRYNDVGPSDFAAIVDYNDTKGLTTDKLKVKIEKTPADILNMTYSPIFVEYLIEKNRY